MHTRRLSFDSTVFDALFEPVLSQRRRPGQPARVAAILRDKSQPSSGSVQQSQELEELVVADASPLAQPDRLQYVHVKAANSQEASDLMDGLLSETVSDILSTY